MEILKPKFDSSKVEKQVIALFNKASLSGKIAFIRERAPLTQFVRYDVWLEMITIIENEVKKLEK